MEVLPAPFGPMMARISPLRMSKETSPSALTPPKASDTFSTDRIASPAATSTRALMRASAARWNAVALPSRRLLHDNRGADVADRDSGIDDALTAVFERDFRCDRGLGRAVIERAHERRVTLPNQAAAHLHGAGQFAIVGLKFLGQNQEAPDLRTRQGAVVGERAVDLVHVRREHVADQGVAGKLLIVPVDDVVALRPTPNCHQIDIEHDGDEVVLVAERHRFLDVGIKLELVLDVFGRKQRAIVEPPHILGAVDDPQVTGTLVNESGIAGTNPTVLGLGIAGLFRILEVPGKYARRLELHFS